MLYQEFENNIFQLKNAPRTVCSGSARINSNASLINPFGLFRLLNLGQFRMRFKNISPRLSTRGKPVEGVGKIGERNPAWEPRPGG